MAITPAVTGQSASQSSVKVRRISIPWTSDASGDVSETITAPNDANLIAGVIVRATFIPGTGGDQPTDQYDVTLTDADGVDVLAGQGANLSDTTTLTVCPGMPLKDGTTTSVSPMVVVSALTLVVANAGDTKQGTVVLYVR